MKSVLGKFICFLRFEFLVISIFYSYLLSLIQQFTIIIFFLFSVLLIKLQQRYESTIILQQLNGQKSVS